MILTQQRFSKQYAIAFVLALCSLSNADPPAKTDSKILFPVEMKSYSLTIVDKAGTPIQGVEVSANGVRCDESPGSWYAWPLKNAGNDNRRVTDQNGVATFRYPVRYGTPPEWLTLNKLTFTLRHPDYVGSGVEADPRSPGIKHSMVAGCPVFFNAVDQDGRPLEKFWALMAGPGRDAKWILEDGAIRTSSIPDGAWQTMLVAPQPNGRTLFSGILPTRFRQNSRVSIRGIKLKPGLRLRGKIDAVVPRPVKNGRVVAWQLPRPAGRCYGNDNPSLHWTDWTKINPDGTFEFASMPRGGTIQLIGLCEGWIGKSTAREGRPANGFFITGIQVEVSDEQIENGLISSVVLPMEPAGSLEISVTKPNGDPLVGAEVAASPNQGMDKGGSQLLGGCFPTTQLVETWMDGKEWDFMAAFRSRESRYTQITDEHGECLIPDVPLNRNQALVLISEDFQIKTKDGNDPERGLHFTLTSEDPNQKLNIEVEAIPK